MKEKGRQKTLTEFLHLRRLPIVGTTDQDCLNYAGIPTGMLEEL